MSAGDSGRVEAIELVEETDMLSDEEAETLMNIVRVDWFGDELCCEEVVRLSEDGVLLQKWRRLFIDEGLQL